MSTTTYEGFLDSTLFRIVLANPGLDEALESKSLPDPTDNAKPSVEKSNPSTPTCTSKEVGPARSAREGTVPVVSTTPDAATENPSLYIHKALLGSLSVELSKHIDNDMKEGRENTMILNEVDKQTLVRFIEWAYTREYQCNVHGSRLLAHIKVYVLADRFNVKALKTLAYSKATSLLVQVGEVKKDQLTAISSILYAMRYAFENLPSRGMFDNVHLIPSPISEVSENNTQSKSQDNILLYLGQYAAWVLDALKPQRDFRQLIEDNVEFAKAVLCHSLQAPGSPWNPIGPEATMLAANNHPLRRKCGSNINEDVECGHEGIAIVQCSSCGHRDTDLGIEVKLNNPAYTDSVLTTGQERVTYIVNGRCKWKCPWCSATLDFPRATAFDANGARAFYNYQYPVANRTSNYNLLFCRRCNGNNLWLP
ncbi:hypothetical protein DFH27DRAFT_600130 [Peziza echinospora]|nr:hypothetical protein DFH27DRAFT_600130 [Peziza echinospora]